MQRISGTILKELRISNGYSLREFARLIYTSKSSLQRWENSTLPDDEELHKRIADIFGMTVDDLYEKSKENLSVKPTEKQITEMQFGIKGLGVILGLLLAFILSFILILLFT